MFDDGDEILIEEPDRMPKDIVLADHAGSFWDYGTPLEWFANQYAAPINRRTAVVPEPGGLCRGLLGCRPGQFSPHPSRVSPRSGCIS